MSNMNALVPTLDQLGIQVQVWPSSGSDGCIVVQIDTPGLEPNDGGLRVNLNDAVLFGPPWTPVEEDEKGDEIVPDYFWRDPNGPGWIDAWNGWYPTLAQAMQDVPPEQAAKAGPWRLQPGSGLIVGDD